MFKSIRRKPLANRSTCLHVERLEDRRVMDAANPMAHALIQRDAGPDRVAVGPFPLGNSSAHDSQPARFHSAGQFEAWLSRLAIQQWSNLFGQTRQNWGGYGTYIPLHLDASLASPLTLAFTTSAATNSFSTTNVQVQGLDEADLVETDGKYLYIISGEDLVIVRAGTGHDLKIASRRHLDQQPVGMYLFGDRLALISSSEHHSAVTSSGSVQSYEVYPTTTITLFDVANRAAPKLVQKTEMDGRLITSRAANGQVRLVLDNFLQLPEPIATPIGDPVPISPPPPSSYTLLGDNGGMTTGFLNQPLGIATGLIATDVMTTGWWPGHPTWQQSVRYESQGEYLSRLHDQIADQVLPHIRTFAPDGTVIRDALLSQPTDFYQPDSAAPTSLATIALFDMTSDQPGAIATTTMATTGTVKVYATPDHIYLFDAHSAPDSGGAWLTKTDVWKFAVDDQAHTISLSAKGSFDGELLNQFAADERDGYLRIVARSNFWPSTGQSVDVLQQVGDRLVVVGSIGGIAPGEDLYSARFIDNRAFFVTFRKIDPLFAVDLSNPTNPRLVGELQIPGYSDYLQPLDANRLLAIGRAADDSGWYQQMQVSIFDVTDLGDPKLVSRYSFGGGNSTSSPALYNRLMHEDGDHHAVTYFDTQQILALPIYTEDNNWWGVDDSSPLFASGHGGLEVFKIDATSGFTPLGVVEHDTLVNRSIQIGDLLFAISSDSVSVHPLTDPTQQLGKVEIANDENNQPAGRSQAPTPIFPGIPVGIDPIAIAPIQITPIGIVPGIIQPVFAQPIALELAGPISAPDGALSETFLPPLVQMLPLPSPSLDANPSASPFGSINPQAVESRDSRISHKATDPVRVDALMDEIGQVHHGQARRLSSDAALTGDLTDVSAPHRPGALSAGIYR
jgi:uncharacterized secreted protein with C-terminal beta-propeller domain